VLDLQAPQGFLIDEQAGVVIAAGGQEAEGVGLAWADLEKAFPRDGFVVDEGLPVYLEALWAVFEQDAARADASEPLTSRLRVFALDCARRR
jgi:hypothetical protein